MASSDSILLTAPPSIDKDASLTSTATDLRLHGPLLSPALGLLIPHARPSPPPSSTATTPSLGSDTDDSDANSSPMVVGTGTFVRQWTGAPIRAIVPLPRRRHIVVPHTSAPVAGHRFWDDDDESDAEPENGKESGEVDVDGNRVSSGSRYCSYESITASVGLSAWSFEELRVECYAQSLVARGTRPLPVDKPALAIPPAFIPRVVSRH